MVQIIASCGHPIDSDWAFSEESNIAIKDYDRESRRCVCYMVVCQKCKESYKTSESVIKTEEDKNEWLKDSIW